MCTIHATIKNTCTLFPSSNTCLLCLLHRSVSEFPSQCLSLFLCSHPCCDVLLDCPFLSYSSFSTIACPRRRSFVPCRSLILTRSWLAMAQHSSEPLPSTALEEIPLSVSPSLTLTLIVPLSPHTSHFQAHGEPLFTFRRLVARLESVAESIMVTATRAPEVPLTPPLS